MPTLTHQTGGKPEPTAGTGQAGSIRAPESGGAGGASAADAWPETGTSTGPAGVAGSGTGRDADPVRSGASRSPPGSQRSGAGRRLAARARSNATGNATRPGPGQRAGTDQFQGPGTDPGGAGSPGPGDAGIDAYPDLDIRQPAPRVDATRREQSGPRYETSPDASASGRTRDHTRGREQGRNGEGIDRAIEEAFFGQRSDLSAHSAEIDRVVERLYREVERRMEIERERRGL